VTDDGALCKKTTMTPTRKSHDDLLITVALTVTSPEIIHFPEGVRIKRP
jgi:hypothetical protein